MLFDIQYRGEVESDNLHAALTGYWDTEVTDEGYRDSCATMAALQHQVTTGQYRITYSEYNPTPEEVKLDVYTYSRQRNGHYVTIITNQMRDDEAAAYNRVQELRGERQYRIQPVLIKEGLIWVDPMSNNNCWKPWWLLEHVAKKGLLFRAELAPIKYLADATMLDVYTDFILRTGEIATLVSTDDGNINLLTVAEPQANGKPRVLGLDEFATVTGLEIGNSDKMPKRLKEIFRVTKMHALMDRLVILSEPIEVIDFDNIGMDAMEIGTDGQMIGSRSFALRVADNIADPDVRRRDKRRIAKGKAVRWNIRVTKQEDEIPAGLIKGDIIIVDDDILEAKYGFVPDLVMTSRNNKVINLKTELGRQSGYWVTMFEHHAHHEPKTNDQLLACLARLGNWLFPEDEMTLSYKSMVDEVLDNLKNGNYPSYLVASSFNNEDERLAAILQNMSVAWTSQELVESTPDDPQYLSLGTSSFLTKRAGEGFYYMLAKNVEGYQVGNVPVRGRRAEPIDDLREEDIEEDQKGFKIAVPIDWAAYVHVTTLAMMHLAGFDPAADGYDTTKSFYYPPAHSFVFPTKVFADNYENHGGWDLDDSLIVMVRNCIMEDGSTKVMAIGVRMPCAWGEWSYFEIDTKDFPFYHTWNEMPTVSLKKEDRPELIQELKEHQIVTGLPTSGRKLNSKYGQVDMMFYLLSAVDNPGIGRVINKMIAYYATADTFLPEQLDYTEALVDCLTQKPDADAFQAIKAEIKVMFNRVLNLGKDVSRYIWYSRMSSVRPKAGTVKLTEDHYFDRMFGMTYSEVIRYNESLKELSVRNRLVITALMEVEVPPETKATAQAAVAEMGKYLTRFRHMGDLPSEDRRRFWGEINSEMVSRVIRRDNWMMLMVAIYQRIIGMGMEDNLLFTTPLNVGEPTMMDLFLITLAHYDVIKMSEDIVWRMLNVGIGIPEYDKENNKFIK